jgi:hypothetical protein
MSQYSSSNSSSGGRLIASWALVVIPLAWGVYHTLLAAGKLFGL